MLMGHAERPNAYASRGVVRELLSTGKGRLVPVFGVQKFFTLCIMTTNLLLGPTIFGPRAGVPTLAVAHLQ